MLDFQTLDDLQKEYCKILMGELPCHLDQKQPPTNRHPFSTITRHPLCHSVQLVMPQTTYYRALQSAKSEIWKCGYVKLAMSLPDLLAADFLSSYVKEGTITMISEPKLGSSIYTLIDGKLKLEVDKPVYERLGIMGKAVKHAGRMHVKERYLIEIDLRLPSMLHGNKSFDRILSAFQRVLGEPLKWLFFYDAGDSSSGFEILLRHDAHMVTMLARQSCTPDVLVPPLDPNSSLYTPPEPSKSSSSSQPSRSSFSAPSLDGSLSNTMGLKYEFFKHTTDELAEWLALVALGSDSVLLNDTTDPVFSRYTLPAPKEYCKEDNIVTVEWEGFIPEAWIMRLYNAVLKHGCSKDEPDKSWFAMTCTAFMTKTMDNDKGYTILTLPRDKSQDATSGELKPRQFVSWEYGGGLAYF